MEIRWGAPITAWESKAPSTGVRELCKRWLDLSPAAGWRCLISRTCAVLAQPLRSPCLTVVPGQLGAGCSEQLSCAASTHEWCPEPRSSALPCTNRWDRPVSDLSVFYCSLRHPVLACLAACPGVPETSS